MLPVQSLRTVLASWMVGERKVRERMGESEFQSLTTLEVQKPARLHRWNEFVSETFAIMHVQPRDLDEFSAKLTRIRIGELGLIWYTTSASSGLVDVGRAGAWSSQHGDSFLFAVQEEGTVFGNYLGREIVSRPGDMVLLDTSRSWQITSDTPVSATAVKIPPSALLGLVPDPEQICGIRLSRDDPQTALASSLILRLKAAVEADPLADWSGFENVLLATIGAALKRAPQIAPPSSELGKLRRQACTIVERNLDDPQLSSASIATSLGTNTRRIQRVFGEMGTTPRNYILERRLNAAAELLRRTGQHDLTITEIAYSVGFGDLSHFDRQFRRRWGMSPREFRGRKVQE